MSDKYFEINVPESPVQRIKLVKGTATLWITILDVIEATSHLPENAKYEERVRAVRDMIDRESDGKINIDETTAAMVLSQAVEVFEEVKKNCMTIRDSDDLGSTPTPSPEPNGE